MQPLRPPIGLQLSHTARTVSRAFNEALEQAGGTLPVWLILLNLKVHPPEHQRALAEAVGVRDATLTHHLNAMEKNGLITRRRDADNRRIHIVALTAAGEEAFLRLRQAAVAFDARLNSGLSDADAGTLSELLSRLAANVGDAQDAAPPWARLAESAASRPARELAGGGEAVAAGPGDQLAVG